MGDAAAGPSPRRTRSRSRPTWTTNTAPWHPLDKLDKAIVHTCIKSRTPRLNGKVERSHRIDAEEFYRLLDGVIIDDAYVFIDKLRDAARVPVLRR